MSDPPKANNGAIRGGMIDHLATLEANWDSYGANPPTEAALLVARNLALVPTADGGLQVEWHCNGEDVEIEVGPDGRFVAFAAERARP